MVENIIFPSCRLSLVFAWVLACMYFNEICVSKIHFMMETLLKSRPCPAP